MTAPAPSRSGTVRLIVNADDFGYFPCVSRGIIEAAAAGTVGATGLLANAPRLAEQVPWLEPCGNLDLGVHLNLTSGRPLTRELAERLDQGRFPGVFAMARAILGGRIGMALVRAEWRAQIETLLALGLRLRFLNSHEHLHMLPGLFGTARALAREYGIDALRLTRADWSPPLPPPALVRNLVLGPLAWLHARSAGPEPPRFIGLGGSGRLDAAYLERIFARLRPGRVYELMCHPGRLDRTQITDPRLLAYHAWEDELALLTGPDFRALCERHCIRLVNYRVLAAEPAPAPS